MEVGITLDWVWYIPDYKNNRELPSEEQLMVEIKPLDHKSKVEWGRQVKTYLPVVGGSRKKRVAEETNASEVQRRMFIKHVRAIKNCKVSGVEITTGEQLLDADGVDSDLITDITNALMDISTLEDNLVKNS